MVVVLIQVLGGGGGGGGAALGGLAGLGQGEQADNGDLERACDDSGDANTSVDCAVAADIESIQDYWTAVLGDRYVPTDTVFFEGQVQTACGGASSGSGPFYCPGDSARLHRPELLRPAPAAVRRAGRALRQRLRDRARVRATTCRTCSASTSRSRRARPGPTSGTVRLELQADCFAGAWANHAETVPDESGEPLIAEINSDDIDRALDAAGRIGDDFIQRELGGGRVDQDAFTHGSSEQRRQWFTTGYETGDPTQCDTFATDDLG